MQKSLPKAVFIKAFLRSSLQKGRLIRHHQGSGCATYPSQARSFCASILQSTARTGPRLADEVTQEISGTPLRSIGSRRRNRFPSTANVNNTSQPILPRFHSKNDYWDYQDQYTSSKSRPVLRYAKTYDFANWLVTTLKGDVIGMDLEWIVGGPVNVSLVQLCDENSILLIHLAAMGSIILPWHSLILGQFPPALKQLLEDPSRIKCGVNIRSKLTLHYVLT